LARLKSLSSASGMADRVRREIRETLPSGRVSAEAVASRLHVSTRSLQRKLKYEGASFQAILDETRAALALIYLRDHKLSVEETSFLLAYRDPNSFYRAFSDWTGMTPAEARAAPSALLA
jgi:AraC-like DNA-binding protein